MPVINSTKLKLERETKGALLYTNPAGNEGQTVTSIYLRKQGFPTGTYPQTISITVETDEDIGE